MDSLWPMGGARDVRRPSLARLVPGIGWMRGYRLHWLPRDAFAAFGVGAMLVAQGMAFAYLLGLAPSVGLWTGVASVLAYAAFGPSRQLMVGPEAGTAILALAAIGPAQNGESALAAFVALAIGVLLLLGGLLQLGAIADFLSAPLLVGYLNGMALVILASQLGDITGTQIEAEDFFPRVIEFAQKFDTLHLPTTLLSLGTIALILVLRLLWPRFPGTVVAVIGGTVLPALLGWEDQIATVGAIDVRLPTIALPPLPEAEVLGRLVPGILAIALLSYASGVLTSRAFGDRHGYRVDANQEFFGMAAANFFAGLVGGYPIGASESRTAVADLSGGRTQMVSVLAAGFLLLTLAFFGPVVERIPLPVLAAVVVTAGLFLLDVRSIAKLARVRPSECAVAVLTIVAVLVLGILPGILVAIGLATLDLVRHAARPHDAILGRIEGKPGYHGIDTEAPSFVVQGLLVYRVDGPLFFANARHVEERVREILDAAPEPVRLVVLDAGAIFDVDYTAAQSLERLHAELESRGSDLAIAEPHEPIRKVLRRSGLLRAIGTENVFPTVGAAIEAYQRRRKEAGKRAGWEPSDGLELPD